MIEVLYIGADGVGVELFIELRAAQLFATRMEHAGFQTAIATIG